MNYPRRIAWTTQRNGRLRSAGGTYEIETVFPPIFRALPLYRLYRVVEFATEWGDGLQLVGEFRSMTEAKREANKGSEGTA